jgi:hypothetical protein
MIRDDLFQVDEAASGMAFRDLLLLLVLSLVAIIFMLTFLVNPVELSEDLPARAEFLVEAFWPEGSVHDVDLWGLGPDGVPVGWGDHKEGPLLNLERDDRGKADDLSELNYETLTVRTRKPGEYVINLHLYEDFDAPLPVRVKVTVTGTGRAGKFFSNEVLLKRRKEEVTVVRFRLDYDGNVIPESVHNLEKSILRLR